MAEKWELLSVNTSLRGVQVTRQSFKDRVTSSEYYESDFVMFKDCIKNKTIIDFVHNGFTFKGVGGNNSPQEKI